MKTDLNILLKGLADIRSRQIYLTKFFTETENVYDDAYAYAVCKSIYPIFHEEKYMETDEEIYKLLLPFYETYKITADTVFEFAEYLDVNWLKHNYFTFSQLESHYSNYWSGIDLRRNLIYCLRYFYLCDKFDKPFWDTILKPMQYPIEADSIRQVFNKVELSY